MKCYYNVCVCVYVCVCVLCVLCVCEENHLYKREKKIKVMVLFFVAVWDTFGCAGVASLHMAYTGFLPAVSQSWHCFTLPIL